MVTMNYDEVIENAKNTYEPRIKAMLAKVRDTVRAAGMSADDEAVLMDGGEDYQWWLRVWRTPEPGKTEDCIDVMVHMVEARAAEGDDGQFGVNFAMSIVAWGGRLLGDFCPYNYSGQCWVNASDAEALEERFKIFEMVDISSIPGMLEA